MIKIYDLTKKFGDTIAVDKLNLKIAEGDAFGFIGPNGAGKTTTIKILATLLRPTEGLIRIGGHSVTKNKDKVKQLVGYMPDFFGVYPELTTWEYLDFFASTYRIPSHKRRGIVDDILELTDIFDKRDEYVDTLSQGMQQKLSLARALIHDPKVLLLDEPASGLDPKARIELREFLKELRKLGKTILISSHILSELAEFCNKIGIVEKGKLIVEGAVDEIKAALQETKVYEITTTDNPAEFEQQVVAMPGTVDVVRFGATVTFKLDENRMTFPRLIRSLAIKGVEIAAAKPQEMTWEQIFIHLTK